MTTPGVDQNQKAAECHLLPAARAKIAAAARPLPPVRIPSVVNLRTYGFHEGYLRVALRLRPSKSFGFMRVLTGLRVKHTLCATPQLSNFVVHLCRPPLSFRSLS